MGRVRASPTTLKQGAIKMAVMNIAVPKAGATATFPVDTDELIGPDSVIPAHAVIECLYQGMKVLLNRGQSKLLSSKGMSGKGLEENKAAIMAAVKEQWENFTKGDIRVTGGKPKEKKGALNTEALRLAKLYIKDQLRRVGEKVSHYPAKEITKGAQMLLDDEEQSAEIWAQARENIDKVEKGKGSIKLDVKAAMKKDPELVKKAEAKKTKKTAEAALSVIAGKKGGAGAEGVTRH